MASSSDHAPGASFADADLRRASFDGADLREAAMRGVDLSDSRIEHSRLRGVVMRGVELVDVAIDGEVVDLRINGVDVAPLVEAELDRRDPDRARMRPSDAAGFRSAWDIVGRRWRTTVERAMDLDPALLHASVDGEWSFIETLRHLVFATDAWIRRGLLGDPRPWDPLGLPWDQMPDTPGVPRDRTVRPSLDEVLVLREDRMATVRQVLANLTDQQLAGETEPVEGPGWPPPVALEVRECLQVVLWEEWHHRNYAERDLDALVGRSLPGGDPG